MFVGLPLKLQSLTTKLPQKRKSHTTNSTILSRRALKNQKVIHTVDANANDKADSGFYKYLLINASKMKVNSN